MAEVVLVYCPVSFNKTGIPGDDSNLPPLGIMYIASYLERYGISVKIFDPGAQNLSLNVLLKKIEDENPIIVGLSALSMGLQSAVQLAYAIKERINSEIKVGIGGFHVNVDPDFINRFPIFDFEIVGEGEKIMLDIVNKIKNGKHISGIYLGELNEDLDILPFPSRHHLDIRNYGIKVKIAPMLSSRGCPYSCLFCSIPQNMKRKIRFRSAKNIVDEMESIYDEYKGYYIFMDDCFNANRKHVLDLCKEIISRQLKIKWSTQVRADLIDEVMIKAMAKSGCNELFFGVESGNEEFRKKVLNKEITDEQIFDAIRLARKYEIQANIFLMIGFPNETNKELEDTINFGSRSKADIIGIRLTVPFPGSKIFEEAIEKGLITKDLIDRYAKRELGDGFYEIWPVYIPKGFSKDEMLNFKKRGYRKFYLNPWWILHRIWRNLRSPSKLILDLKYFGAFIHTLIYGKTKTAMN